MSGWMHTEGLRGRMLRGGVGAVAAMSILSAGTGCEDGWERTFRAAAGDSLEAGVMAILEGITTGAFAVFDAANGANGPATTTGGGETTTEPTATAAQQP